MQPTARRTLLERHGRLMGRFRWVIIPLWIALLVGAVMLGGRLGDVTTSEATLPGTEGQKGLELIETHFSDGKDSSDIQPVFRNRDLTVDDAGYRSAVTASLDRAAALVPGTRVVSYFSTGSRDLVGQDGHMTFATLSIPVGEQVAADMMPGSARRSARPTASSRPSSAARRRWSTTPGRSSTTTSPGPR